MNIQSYNGPGSEKIIRSILDYIADPVFVKDRQHKWVYLNRAYCDFMGYRREELLGKTDYDYFPKAEADVFWQKDEIVFVTKEENTNEENFTDSHGVTHNIITKKVLLKTEEGEDLIVGIIRDVTDLKASEKELRKKMVELEAFNKAAVDRELVMVELKEKIRKLESRLKETP